VVRIIVAVSIVAVSNDAVSIDVSGRFSRLHG
jgi:hypothetical protein